MKKHFAIFLVLIVLSSSLYNFKDVSSHLIYTSIDVSVFSASGTGSWVEFNLFSDKSIPKGAVVDIVIRNGDADNERTGGIRSTGSSIERKIAIHEAEGGGYAVMEMLVQTNSSDGTIEVYAETADIDFVILGYFEGCNFTDKFYLVGEWWNAWVDVDVSGSGVPSNAVMQMLIGNNQTGMWGFVGVREEGSILINQLLIHESEGGGWTLFSQIVKNNEAGIIEWRGTPAEGFGNYFWVLGWFGPNVDYIEVKELVTFSGDRVDNVWESRTLTEPNASTIISFHAVHADAGSETSVGVREEGSLQERRILVHEAEAGGWAGYLTFVDLDADKKIEIYSQDSSESEFRVFGYFSFIESPCVPPVVNVTGEWVEYQATSINTSIGIVDAGDLNSTFEIDGDTFNVSEVVGVPGMLISVNFTGVDPDAECVWVTIWYLYDGNLNHDFDIEMWNFTSSAWVDDGHLVDGVIFSWANSTIYALRIPNDFLSGGEVRVQLNHESPGNMNHDLFIDYIRLIAKIPSDVAAAEEPFQFFWIVVAMALTMIILIIAKIWFEEGDP